MLRSLKPCLICGFQRVHLLGDARFFIANDSSSRQYSPPCVGGSEHAEQSRNHHTDPFAMQVLLHVHTHIHHNPNSLLLQRDKSRRVRGTDTRTTVLDRLVRDGEFTEVVADHLGLDFDLVEFLARVDTDDGADHLRHDDHVSQVCLDQVGLLVGLRVLLGLAQLLDQTHRAALQAAVESTAGAGVQDREQFVGRDVEESVWARRV